MIQKRWMWPVRSRMRTTATAMMAAMVAVRRGSAGRRVGPLGGGPPPGGRPPHGGTPFGGTPFGGMPLGGCQGSLMACGARAAGGAGAGSVLGRAVDAVARGRHGLQADG